MSITLHRDSGLLAVICDDLVVRIVDIETRRIVRELGGFRGRILDLVSSTTVCIADGYSRFTSYKGLLTRLAVACYNIYGLHNPDVRYPHWPPYRFVPYFKCSAKCHVLANELLLGHVSR